MRRGLRRGAGGRRVGGREEGAGATKRRGDERAFLQEGGDLQCWIGSDLTKGVGSIKIVFAASAP